MYWNAGVRPGSSHSALGTTASRSIAQGHAVEIVQQLLGQAQLDDGRHCLQMSQKRPEAMFTDMLQLGVWLGSAA